MGPQDTTKKYRRDVACNVPTTRNKSGMKILIVKGKCNSYFERIQVVTAWSFS